MNIPGFSIEYRVRTRREECGETIIRGRLGHVFDHGDGGRFGVLLLLPTKRRWNHARKRRRAAGFHVHQDAETEGTALFDPTDPGQVRLALRIVGAKRKRTASRAQLQALKRARAALRIHQNHCAERVFAP